MLEDPQTDRRRNDPDCPEKKARIISAVEQMSEAIQDIQHKFSSHLEDYQSDKESTNARLNTLESQSGDIADIKASVEQNTKDLSSIIPILTKTIPILTKAFSWYERAKTWALVLVIVTCAMLGLSKVFGIDVASEVLNWLLAKFNIKL